MPEGRCWLKILPARSILEAHGQFAADLVVGSSAGPLFTIAGFISRGSALAMLAVDHLAVRSSLIRNRQSKRETTYTLRGAQDEDRSIRP
jgi:hypothetical protein